MKPHHVPSSAPLLATVSAAVLLAACGGNSDGDAEAPLPKPTAIVNGVPEIDPAIAESAKKVMADKKLQDIVAELSTAASEKARFNQHMELVRIASPSRYENRMAVEVRRRMVNEWGYLASEVKTRADGNLPGSDVQIVDGLPVYNACVEIKGSYSSSPNRPVLQGPVPQGAGRIAHRRGQPRGAAPRQRPLPADQAAVAEGCRGDLTRAAGRHRHRAGV